MGEEIKTTKRKQKTLEEKLKRPTHETLFADPATMDTICSNIAEGLSLIDLCKTWSVGYSKVLRWIRADSVRLKAYNEALADRDEWTKDLLLRELRSIATSDLREAFDDAGKLKHPSQWPDSIARAVAGLEVFEEFAGKGDDREYIGDTKKLKLWDKTKSLELIGKTMALFVDKKEHSLDSSLEDILAASWGNNGKSNDTSSSGSDQS